MSQMSQSEENRFSTPKKNKNKSNIIALNTPERKTKLEFISDLWQQLNKRISNVIENNSNVTFEEIENMLKDKTMLELVSRFWSLLKGKRVEKGKMTQEMRESRMILCTLMIYYFPEIVLDSTKDKLNMDALTENCYNSATAIVDTVFLHKIENKRVSNFECEEALMTINEFLEDFPNWQKKDKRKMIKTLSNYYEEWLKSQKVLKHTSLNDLRRKGILDTIDDNLSRTKVKLMSLIKNQDEVDRICHEITEKVEKEKIEPMPTRIHKNDSNVSNVSNTNDENNNISINETTNPYENTKDTKTPKNEKESIEEELKRRGIPSEIKTGFNLRKDLNKNTTENVNSNEEQKIDENGMVRIDLNEIVMEEASKKYWSEFSEEIKENKYHRLIELLEEILKRLKKISPQKDLNRLDELIDVSFLQQTIEKGLIDSKSFFYIFSGLWEQIKSLHSASKDKSWIEWHDSIIDELNTNKATWYELLPKIFNRFLVKLDEIEENIMHYQHLLKKDSKLKNSNNSNKTN